MSFEMKIETLHKSSGFSMERVWTHGGWIVLINRDSARTACFVPDKNNTWKLKNNSKEKNRDKNKDALFFKVNEIVSPRVSAALISASYVYVGDIVCNIIMAMDRSFYRLRHLRNFGQKSYTEIINALMKLGFNEPFLNDDYWKEKLKSIKD